MAMIPGGFPVADIISATLGTVILTVCHRHYKASLWHPVYNRRCYWIARLLVGN